MKIISLFKDALNYPTKNLKIFLIIGILSITAASPSFLPTSFLNFSILATAIIIISLAVIFILIGYSLSITRDTINNSNSIPSLKIWKNFIDGIRLAIVTTVYYIIPAILLIVIAQFLGIFKNIATLINYYNLYGVEYVSHMPPSDISSIGQGFFIILIVIFILVFLTIIFSTIAECRLAKYNSLKSSFNLKEIYKIIGKIGFGNYSLWIIVFLIITFVLGIISISFGVFGVLGLIISLLLISPYITLFSARAIGLVYKESEKEKYEVFESNYPI